MKICIVIPTYRRNEQLFSLLNQCAAFMNEYRGPNAYDLAVTDSDRNNPMAESIRQAGMRYVINPGQGFDDNLYYFYASSSGTYDYIFSISDDDMFFVQRANPLYMLDVAVLLGRDAVMFNHRDYQRQDSSNYSVRPAVYYTNPLLSCNDDVLAQAILSSLPRHVGLLYSTHILRKYDNVISQFRGTLHLYAIPAILAAVDRNAAFLDYCLCLFHHEIRDDGAWESTEAVFHGILAFLKKLKTILPSDLYQVSEEGFMAEYLGDQAWLRKMVSPQHTIPNEQAVRAILAAP